MRDYAINQYPVQNPQLEFNFEEKTDDESQDEPCKGVHSMETHEGLLPDPERPLLQEVRGKRNLDLFRVDQQLFELHIGYGQHATGMQRSVAS